LPTERLINELQTFGVRLVDPKAGLESRRGGAGPSDHKALTIDGVTVMTPVHTAPAFESPYVIDKLDAEGRSRIARDGETIGEAAFVARPRFYDLSTADGVPYSKIAVLHGRDVLATTVLQSCVRYQSRLKACQFCAIGQSLAAGRTIERKSPAQLAEVAKAAVELDDVKHMVMTTGTPRGADRGAAILCECAAAVKAAVDLPIQGQCEPPDDEVWFERLKAAGVDAIGMHHAGQGRDLGRTVSLGFREGGLDIRPRAGLDVHPRGPRRPAGGNPRDVREAG
jgi:radical SAM protein (TIGR04043 family)